MSKQLTELETILSSLIVEHEKLLRNLESHQAAMAKLDIKAMDDAGRLQEATRMRIVALESRRKSLVDQIAASMRVQGPPTLQKLAEAAPPFKSRLLGLRDQLKAKVSQVAARAHIAGRLAGGVLGHLNTAVRLLAGAVEQAGVYTKQGVPQASARIGMMEAVG